MVNAPTFLTQDLPLNSSLIALKPNLNFFDDNQNKFTDFIKRELKVIVLTSILTGTVIGIICYLYKSFQQEADFSFTSPYNSSSNPILKKRAHLLNEMESLMRTMEEPVSKAFNEFKSFIERTFPSSGKQFILQFQVSHQHYELHDKIALITDKIREKRDITLKNYWQGVLLSLHRTPVAYGNYRGKDDTLIFDASHHLNRLEGKMVTCEIVELTTCDEEILEQLHQMDFECFLNDSNPRFMEYINNKHCLIARDKETGEILGALVYIIEKDIYHIARLGRAAKAARLRIGESLLKEGLEKIKKERRQSDTLSTRVILEVRKSNNLAIKCYQKFNFIMDNVRAQHYLKTQPYYRSTHYSEDAEFMVLELKS